MFLFKGNTLRISFCGIKISFRINNFLKNEVYLVNLEGKRKRIYSAPKGLKIVLLGENAKIYLPKGKCFKKSKLVCYSDSVVNIEKPHVDGLNNLFLEVCKKCNLYIQSETSMMGGFISVGGEGRRIEIGSDCMFSDGILIRTHDGHVIYDKTTKEPINNPKDVVIGNHCWLAKEAKIFKGVKLANNIVVAANTLVTKSVEEENVIVAGSPAKIVKTNIDWDRKFNDVYLNEIQRRCDA
ncbi:MAG: acyltransferase [Cyanobacteria bacterium SIG28]|nr:acyltransferase [Cyanobacteria bacterium SIG28]